jgi:serine/threonine-protein kinase
MPDTRWTRVKDAFLSILDLPAADRPAALAALDDDLREEVEALLAADASDDDPLAQTPALFDVAEAVAHLPVARLGPGSLVGPYRIEASIGRGGMGEVFRATRADGLVTRPVALKLVRGAGSESVLARFDAERRVLARLQHPGIARLLDAGTVEGAQPWIAMDYVHGAPITDYAAAHALRTAERVRLLAETARIVHEAHRNLVVHRDLKPSNVLVREDADGAPQPALLDFGIAKLLDADPDAAPITEEGKGPMTRAYAAPEQLRGDPATTATDVYALGLLLYELLTGTRPFADAPTPAAYEQAVLATDPAPPSRIADATTSGTGRALRGDLDTICLTALHKDPARRYPSAEALAADLQRHLDGLPITARPPTLGYRARKFVRRHRAAVAAAALGLAALLAGGALHTARVAAERDRAEAARDEAEAAADFLATVFVSADPFETTRRDTLRLVDLLDDARARVETDLADQPRLQARLFVSIAEAYGSMARFEPADSLLRAATERLATATPAERASVRVAHADLLVLWGGEERQAEAVGLYEQAIALGGDPLGIADAQAKLAIALNRNGNAAAADSLFVASIRTHRAAGVPDSSAYGIALGQHAVVLSAAGRDREATDAVQEALAVLTDHLGADHPHVGVEHFIAGAVHYAAGRPAEALPHYREAHRIDEAVLGADHPNTLDALQMQGVVATEQGDAPRAVAMLAEAVRRLEAAHGGQDPRLPFYLYSYGSALTAAGRFADAERQLGRALPLMRSIHGDDNWGVGGVLGVWGRLDLRRGNATAALPRLRQALSLVEGTFGPEHMRTLRGRAALAEALIETGAKDEARRLLGPVRTAYRARFGAAAAQTREVEAMLGRAR